jgi:hypothetical protein
LSRTVWERGSAGPRGRLALVHITLEVIEYTSLTEVAKAIGVSRTAVKKAIISEKPIKKIYCCKQATKNKR